MEKNKITSASKKWPTKSVTKEELAVVDRLYSAAAKRELSLK